MTDNELLTISKYELREYKKSHFEVIPRLQAHIQLLEYRVKELDMVLLKLNKERNKINEYQENTSNCTLIVAFSMLIAASLVPLFI